MSPRRDRRGVAKQTRKGSKKRCAGCGKWDELEKFPRNRATADGRSAYCRSCKRDKDRQKRGGAEIIDLAGAVSRPSKRTPSRKSAEPDVDEALWRRRRSGRPSKLNDEVIDTICDVLARGHTRRAAAAKAGVDDSTLMRWLADGRDETTGLKRELFLSVLEAEAHGEHQLVEIVRAAADIDPQYAKWLLERRHHVDWARREQLAVSGGEGKPMEVAVVRELVGRRLEGLGLAAEAPEPPAPQTEAPDS